MNLFWVVLVIVIISTVVGAVARLFNNLNEMQAANKNRPAPRANGGAGAGAGGGGGSAAVRQTNSDMDRFLAEIDRLRRKNADAPPPQPGQQTPVVQPVRQPDRPRPRVVAEVAEPARQDYGFNAAPGMPSAPPSAATGPKAGDLPLATVVTPSGGTGAPAATRVTRFTGRARPTAKTPFAKNLTTLLASGNGLALAVVLQEVLGPPRSKKG